MGRTDTMVEDEAYLNFENSDAYITATHSNRLLAVGRRLAKGALHEVYASHEV